MKDETLEQLRGALLEPASRQDEAAAVAAFVDALPTQRGTMLRKVKVAVATVAGGLVLTTGLAAADVLPGAAQDVAVTALEKVGIDLEEKANEKADTRGRSAEHRNSRAGANDVADLEGEGSGSGKGGTISSIAHDPALEGVEKGSAVCTAASEEQCRAGEEHPGTTPPSTPGAEHRPADVPAGSGHDGPPDGAPSDMGTQMGRGGQTGGQGGGTGGATGGQPGGPPTTAS